MTGIILSLILAGIGVQQACYGFMGMGAYGLAEHFTGKKPEKKPWGEFWQMWAGVALVLAALAVARWA
jgi:hypothetical protein